MAFEGWDVPGFTRNKHRDLMMQFRSNTKLEKELGSRTGFRKKVHEKQEFLISGNRGKLMS